MTRHFNARKANARVSWSTALAFIFVVSAAFGSAVGLCDANAQTFAGFSPADVRTQLTDHKVEFNETVDPDGDPFFVLKLRGLKVTLAMYRDEGLGGPHTSLRLRAGFSSPGPVPPELINRWNRERATGTAFLTSPNTAVLKADIDTAAGISPAHFRAFVDRFADSSEAFQRFLNGE